MIQVTGNTEDVRVDVAPATNRGESARSLSDLLTEAVGTLVVTVSFGPNDANELRDDSDFSLLLGGEWSFNRDWSLRLEYELFDLDTLGMTEESTVNSSRLSFGAHYRFGRR